MAEFRDDVNDFLSEASAKGYELQHSQVRFDGAMVRFPIGKSKDAGWLVAYDNLMKDGKRRPVIVYGDWKSGEKYTYISGGKDLTDAENRAIRKKIAEEKDKFNANREETQAAVALAAQQRWAAGSNGASADSHPYIIRKGLKKSYRMRVDTDGNLMVPQVIGSTIWGIQSITPDGDKFFMTGQKFKGTYIILGDVTDEMYLCEGYATGGSIHEATGKSVIVAFSAGNLKAVAEQFRGYKIIVCGDDDRFTQGNPGKKAAEEAAKILETVAIYPIFTEENDNGTDFNDYHCAYGQEKLAELFNDVPHRKEYAHKNAEEGGDQKSEDRPWESYDKKGNKKINYPLFYTAIVDVFRKANSPLPPVKESYVWIEDERGGALFSEIFKDKVIRYISADKIKRSIGSYISSQELRKEAAVTVDASKIKPIFEEWHACSQPLDEKIYPVAFKSDDVHCWVKLPWDLEEGYEGKTPHFDSLFKRISNAEALRLWIGSLFIPQSDRQQYVWMYGEGGEGKSSLARFLDKLFGSTVAYLEPTEEKSQFFTSQIVGKRLGIINECENMKFVTSGKLKSVVAGDKVKIEYKGENAFYYEPMVKILISSNNKPAISGKTSDLRRLIYCQFEPIPEGQSMAREAFDKALWNEGKWFVSRCIAEYYMTCPMHGELPSVKDMAEAIGELSEMRYEAIVDKYFTIQDPRPTLVDVQAWDKTSRMDVFDLLKDDGFTAMEIHRFYEYIERKHKIILKRVGSGDRVRCFFGMKRKICGGCKALAHAGKCPPNPDALSAAFSNQN